MEKSITWSVKQKEWFILKSNSVNENASLLLAINSGFRSINFRIAEKKRQPFELKPFSFQVSSDNPASKKPKVIVFVYFPPRDRSETHPLLASKHLIFHEFVSSTKGHIQQKYYRLPAAPPLLECYSLLDYICFPWTDPHTIFSLSQDIKQLVAGLSVIYELSHSWRISSGENSNAK